MLGCGKFLSVGGEFVVEQVVELLCAHPLVVLYNMPVADVRVVEFGTYRAKHAVLSAILLSYVVCLSVCPSVCPSVTLVICGHIGWVNSKVYYITN